MTLNPAERHARTKMGLMHCERNSESFLFRFGGNQKQVSSLRRVPTRRDFPIVGAMSTSIMVSSTRDLAIGITIEPEDHDLDASLRLLISFKTDKYNAMGVGWLAIGE